MATLLQDLLDITDYVAGTPGDLKALPEALPEGLEKIDWKRLTCFILPIANVFLAAKGFPPLPIPAFCTTPADPLA